VQDSRGTATANTTGSASSAAAWVAIAGHAPAGIAITAGAGHHIEYANRAFASLTGAPENQIVGRAIRDLIRTPALVERLDAVLVTCKPAPGAAIHTDDGGTFLLAVWPRGDAGDAGGVVVELTATEIVPYEPDRVMDGTALQSDDSEQQELRQHSDELREINARLVRSALREEQLAEQERAASRAKSEFLAVVSHELRTPLTAVIGYTDMLQTGLGGLNEKGAGWADRIRFSAWHLREIVDDLISTISENRAPDTLVPEATAADVVVREAIALVETAAREKDLEIRTQVPPHTIPLQIDRRKLRQVLTNILSNAVKFTEHGTIEVSVDQDGDAVNFRVTDSGIGIAEVDLDRIFEPFVQVDSSTTRRFGGCGLGLGLSRRFARAMGGDLTVTSELGRGSTFVVTVPAFTEGESPSINRSPD
jgi:signal transduction histidine kinase